MRVGLGKSTPLFAQRVLYMLFEGVFTHGFSFGYAAA
jgi:hypothetical protein